MPIFVISGQLNGYEEELCSDIKQYIGETAELGISPDSVVVFAPKRDNRTEDLVISVLGLTEKLSADACKKAFSGIVHIVKYYIGNERCIQIRPVKAFDSKCAV